MKGAVFTEFGPPEVLHLREVAAPVARGHDILVRVHATSVNFGDLLVRNFAAVSPRAFQMPCFVDRPDTYDVIIDILGKSSFARCRPILNPHGRVVFVSFKMKQILQMLWTSVISDKKVICALVTERQEDLVSIRTLVETGKLRSIVDRSFPLEEAAAAHRYAESGAKQGSVLISLASIPAWP